MFPLVLFAAFKRESPGETAENLHTFAISQLLPVCSARQNHSSELWGTKNLKNC